MTSAMQPIICTKARFDILDWQAPLMNRSVAPLWTAAAKDCGVRATRHARSQCSGCGTAPENSAESSAGVCCKNASAGLSGLVYASIAFR